LAEPANPTTLLLAWGRGDQAALGHLLPLVHDELRRPARRHMARENQVRWQNRAHFFAKHDDT
jgi:hypothetical protein